MKSALLIQHAHSVTYKIMYRVDLNIFILFYFLSIGARPSVSLYELNSFIVFFLCAVNCFIKCMSVL